jgi:hypothetical protein
MRERITYLFIIFGLLLLIGVLAYVLHDLQIKTGLLELQLNVLQQTVLSTKIKLESMQTPSFYLSEVPTNHFLDKKEIIKNVLLAALLVAAIIAIGFVSYKLCVITVTNYSFLMENITSNTELIVFKVLKSLGFTNELILKLKGHEGVDFIVTLSNEKIDILVKLAEDNIMELPEYIDFIVASRSGTAEIIEQVVKSIV